MKNLFFALMALILLTSFGFVTYLIDLNNRSAEVTQIQGVSIFTDALPLKQYDILGEHTQIICVACDYSDLRDKAVKQALKLNGNGVILSGKVNNKFTIIKFK